MMKNSVFLKNERSSRPGFGFFDPNPFFAPGIVLSTKGLAVCFYNKYRGKSWG